jgi:hypothetical protein
MKLPKELLNGLIIIRNWNLFLNHGTLGLADIYILRVFNVLFIFYGTNRTLKSNFAEGKTNLVILYLH